MVNKFIELGLRAIRTIPVIFITAVIVWSYYAYVLQMCIFTIGSTVKTVFYLIFFHIILLIFLWSYWKTIFTPIALPPDEYFISNMDELSRDLLASSESRKKTLNAFGKSLGVQCRLANGDVRFCEKCNCIKPDRAHHCSVCRKCILKLDHHCPWVNNCVCFSNYKFFILFLFYTMVYCVFIFATSFEYFITFWTGISSTKVDLGSLHVVFLFFASIMFFISSMALFSFHCYLIALNKSTIESFQVPIFSNGVKDSNAFNIGVKRNFYEVFGNRPLYWFLPIFTGYGDGLKYPTSTSSVPANNYNTMESNLNSSYGNSTVINMNSDDFHNTHATMTATATSTTLLDDRNILLNNNDEILST